MSSVAQTAKERKLFIKNAEMEGNGVVLGGPSYLQLDLDSEGDYNRAIELIITFRPHLPIKSIWRSMSKSGNKHIHIFLTESMERRDRVFWQCALGSDHVREGLYWVRLNEGKDEESFFVECSGHRLTKLFTDDGILIHTIGDDKFEDILKEAPRENDYCAF